MLDTIDHDLLALLQENCRLSYAELGEKVGLSISAINERLKKLHNQGVIQRFVAILDPTALNLTISAYIEVAIEKPKRAAELLDHLKKRPEVLECHNTTGDYPLLLKVIVPDQAALEDFLNRHIRPHRGVTRTRVSIILSSPKQATALPLPKRDSSK